MPFNSDSRVLLPDPVLADHAQRLAPPQLQRYVLDRPEFIGPQLPAVLSQAQAATDHVQNAVLHGVLQGAAELLDTPAARNTTSRSLIRPRPTVVRRCGTAASTAEPPAGAARDAAKGRRLREAALQDDVPGGTDQQGQGIVTHHVGQDARRRTGIHDRDQEDQVRRQQGNQVGHVADHGVQGGEHQAQSQGQHEQGQQDQRKEDAGPARYDTEPGKYGGGQHQPDRDVHDHVPAGANTSASRGKLIRRTNSPLCAMPPYSPSRSRQRLARSSGRAGHRPDRASALGPRSARRRTAAA